MIDLHCHMLPGIDDGAPDIGTALAMARIAVRDGIRIAACTPHIYPGMYENTAESIRQGAESFRAELAAAGIPLEISYASDTHVMPDLLERLQSGTVPTFNGGSYFLLEPPHHVAPPNFEEFVYRVIGAGYVPIVTHPERLHWIEDHYQTFARLARQGVWMQITAGSLTGRFGAAAKYWGERMLDEGLVHILATDSHDVEHRPPLLGEGLEAARRIVGAEEADRLVNERPAAALNNDDPLRVTPIPACASGHRRRVKSFFARMARYIDARLFSRC
jgi:protein-tyrosine phosphatase